MRDYEKQVYTAIVGKTIGVYLGRPFEGSSKKTIEKTWGPIDRYLHERKKFPLVVADDDLSGTLRFVMALEDSGLYADTPAAFFGKMWLDCVIEGKSIFWWGGFGNSTEHTAYLRLKQGVPAPRSGSMALNGRVVAEQIGAQIFIDAFGMVAPGKPSLAAKLARRSASVSHDGEAIHAAVVVAAMVSAAFVEKKMEKVIAAALDQIPSKSLIAHLHHDIAGWVRKDGNWQKTFDRIEKKYGYETFGGNCHVVPNHAIMVMAWLYSPDNFHRALTITCTAGWDTDCNAGNVGSVLALILGLDSICEQYDYRSPFADRLLIPTAGGSAVSTDCLAESIHISRIGRKIMGWRSLDAPKKGAWHHFEMDGALHGYMAEDETSAGSGITSVTNVAGHSELGTRSMRLAFKTRVGGAARVSTQTLARHKGIVSGYDVMATPKIYPGNTLTAVGEAGSLEAPTRLRLFVRTLPEEKGKPSIILGKSVAVKPSEPFRVTLAVPRLKEKVVGDFGFQLESGRAASGEIFVDSVSIGGRPKGKLHQGTAKGAEPKPVHGFIFDTDMIRGPFSEDATQMDYGIKSSGQGVFVTGNTDWKNYTARAAVRIHLAKRGGLMSRYRGLTRHLSLQLVAGGKIQLLSRHYDKETILDQKNFKWSLDTTYTLELRLDGEKVVGLIDGKLHLDGRDKLLGCGGAGLVWTDGIMGFRDLKIS